MRPDRDLTTDAVLRALVAQERRRTLHVGLTPAALHERTRLPDLAIDYALADLEEDGLVRVDPRSMSYVPTYQGVRAVDAMDAPAITASGYNVVAEQRSAA